MCNTHLYEIIEDIDGKKLVCLSKVIVCLTYLINLFMRVNLTLSVIFRTKLCILIS